jgi:hypothetical protein
MLTENTRSHITRRIPRMSKNWVKYLLATKGLETVCGDERNRISQT